MDFHSPNFKGNAKLDPTASYSNPRDLVPREYVNGILTITDVVPTADGIVGYKEYTADTIPADIELTKCITDTTKIRVWFEAEPDRVSRKETITINGVPQTMIQAKADNSRLFTGYVDLDIAPDQGDVELHAISSTGAEYKCVVTPLIGGPTVASLTIDEIPVGQTHVKQNDKVKISGVVANDAVSIKALAKGLVASEVVLNIGAEDSAGQGSRRFDGEVTVSGVSSDAKVTVIAENFLGTEGDEKDSIDVLVDQTYPTIPNATYTYPAGQLALKDGEAVTITSAISDADSAIYSIDGSVAAGFDITDPAVMEDDKVITMTSGENFSFDNQYYIVTATRANNGAARTRKFTIDIANAEPTIDISIVGNPSHLRSSVDGNDYNVRVNSDQPIDSAPSLDAQVGAWKGNWSKVNEKTWQRTVTISDSDAKGTHAFENLVATGRALVETNTINGGAAYTIQGFLIREVTVPALSQKVAIGTFVTDPTKITAYYKDADQLTYRPNLDDVPREFSVVDAAGDFDPQGNYFWISDVAFAGSNTSGTLVITVEEA